MKITANEWGDCTACKMDVKALPSGEIVDPSQIEVVEKAGSLWYGLAPKLIYWPMPAAGIRLVDQAGAAVEIRAGARGYRPHEDTCGADDEDDGEGRDRDGTEDEQS